MPKHMLTADWTKIASAGENVRVMNVGQAVVDVGRTKIPPGGEYGVSDLRSDLLARSGGPRAEVVTVITPGMPRAL